MSNNQRFKDPRGGFCGHYQNVKLLINNGLAKFFESFFTFLHTYTIIAGRQDSYLPTGYFLPC